MRHIIDHTKPYCSDFIDAQNLFLKNNNRFQCNQHGNSFGKNAIFEIERYSTAVHIFKRTGLKKLIIGTTLSYFPINFRDTDQQFKGYAVDLCNALGKYLGIDIAYQGYSNAFNMIRALQKKEVNLIISCIAISAARRLIMDFSIPYFTNELGIIASNKYKDLKTWRELDQPHIKIAVSYGSIYDTITQKTLKKANIQKFNGLNEAGQALLTGQVDAVINDNVWAKHFVQRNQERTSSLTNIIEKSFPAGIAVNKGQRMILDTINIFLSQYNGSAFEAANYKRWLAGEVG